MIDHQELNNRIYALPVEDQNKVVDFVAALEKRGREDQASRRREAFNRLDVEREEIKGYFPPDFDAQAEYFKAIDEKYGCFD